jgi:hypothetical protein
MNKLLERFFIYEKKQSGLARFCSLSFLEIRQIPKTMPVKQVDIIGAEQDKARDCSLTWGGFFKGSGLNASIRLLFALVTVSLGFLTASPASGLVLSLGNN